MNDLQTIKIHWTAEQIVGLQNVLNTIKQFINVNPTEENRKRLLNHCIQLFVYLPICALEVTEKMIVRARRNENGEIFFRQTQVSYNTEKVDKIYQGRFNRPKQATYYGSLPIISTKANSSITAIIETHKELLEDSNENDFRYTVSRWSVTPFMCVCLCFNDNHLSSNPRMKDIVHEFLVGLRSNSNDSSYEFIIEAYDYLSHIASKKSININTYLLSSTIFEAMVIVHKQSGNEINGLIYPSAHTDCMGLNIAIFPEAVDKYLTLSDVVMYKVQKDNTNLTLDIEVISKIAKVQDGHFKIEFLT